jgi:hypothetical protein
LKNIQEGIEKTLEGYRECWSRLDFAALRRLWDAAEPRPVYLAEEIPAPLFDWNEIEGYWAATRGATRSIRIETWNLSVQPLAPDLASALYEMRWIGEFSGYARPIGGDVRVSALLRRRDDGWRFIQYVEAPLAPIVYFRRCYERFADSPPPRGP